MKKADLIRAEVTKKRTQEKINNDNMLLGIPNTIDNDGKKIANYRGIGLSDMIYSIENKNNQLEVSKSLILAPRSKSRFLVESKILALFCLSKSKSAPYP